MVNLNRNDRHAPRRLADRYDVEQPIGEGASAITYRGWDSRLERPVAIKILRETFARDETYVRRFRQEARAAASVNSPYVVDVYDFGQDDLQLYIVMQLIDGEDLKARIARDAPLPVNDVERIALQVLDGLSAIHHAGIIHRDIKPQNVLIGHDGIARVTDFGVVQQDEDSGLTLAGTTVGTAAYMAPEQAQGHRISEATDLYAVGVMLYEMVTGFLPFNGPNPVALMLEHIQQPVIPPSQRNPGNGITPSIDRVILQAMAKSPDERFRNATAMRDAIQRAFNVTDGWATGGTTVWQPAVQPPTNRTQVGARSARPVSNRQVRQQPVPGYVPDEEPDDVGAGVNGAVKLLFGLLCLALLAVGAWYAVDRYGLGDLRDGSDGPTATSAPAVATSTDVPEPTSTSTDVPEPTATDGDDSVIEPLGPPTNEPTTVPPTDVPTQVPTETPALEPTDVPTDTPTEEPTSTAPPDVAPTETSPPILPVD